MNSSIIKVTNLFKSFLVGEQHVEVLRGISFWLEPRDFLIVFGPSGCGKSTLLHTILGLEKPTRGKVLLFGKNIYQFSEDKRSELRKRHVGMVYQQPNWIRSLSVLENVAFPLLLLGEEREKALKKAEENLGMVGMKSWSSYLPTELSAGQQQKVSLARAMVHNPSLIIADEPTGNLDTQSGEELMRLLASLNKKGKTIMMVTHDLEYLGFASRIWHMIDGRIDKEYKGKSKGKAIKKLIGKGKKGNS
jgi:putative ABC transport system ATP-binding protein